MRRQISQVHPVNNHLRNKGETSQIQNTSFACEDMARFSTIILQIKPAVVSLPYSKFNKRPTFSTRNTATLMAVTRYKKVSEYTSVSKLVATSVVCHVSSCVCMSVQTWRVLLFRVDVYVLYKKA